MVRLVCLPDAMSYIHTSRVIEEVWCLRHSSSNPFRSWYRNFCRLPHWNKPFRQEYPNLFRFSTFGRNLIQFCHGRSREQCTAGRVLNACRKYNKLSVRCKRREGISEAEFVVSLRAEPPLAGITNTSVFPKRSLAKAICLPSGDHTETTHTESCVVQLYCFSTLGRHFVNVAPYNKNTISFRLEIRTSRIHNG